MKKYLKSLPLWAKFAIVSGFMGLIATLMQSADPSFVHLNLIAVSFGATAWAIL